MGGRGAVVLNGLPHHPQLVLAEPALQSQVGSHDFSACDVMNGTRSTHSNIVIGGDSVYHIHIGTGLAGKFQAVLDDPLHMYQPMTLAEFVVFRQDAGFHKMHQIEAHILINHSLTGFLGVQK